MAHQQPLTTLGSVLRGQEEDLAALRALPQQPTLDDEQDILTGKITTSFRANNQFLEFTGFSEGAITNIVELATPLTMQARTRGPLPKSSVSDMIICYLLQYRVDLTAAQRAKIVNLPEGRYSSNVDRIRPILRAALKERWSLLIPRPASDVNRHYAYAGLLVDATTIECFRPEGRFEEAKHYYDGKNHIYGLKTEVAVTAASPHFYLSSSPHRPASVHDYTIHKSWYQHYLDYLRKLPEERNVIVDPQPNEDFWALVLDRAYIGPHTDTPHLRRITPVKNPLTVAQRTTNSNVDEDRVPIEQFFGRLGSKFVVYRKIYKFDHRHFDADFEIACLLTNEDVLLTALSENDLKVYRGLQTRRQQEYDDAMARDKAARLRHQENKRRRLNSLGQYVPGNRKD
jgi:DDE superfamily endonuclease